MTGLLPAFRESAACSLAGVLSGLVLALTFERLPLLLLLRCLHWCPLPRGGRWLRPYRFAALVTRSAWTHAVPLPLSGCTRKSSVP